MDLFLGLAIALLAGLFLSRPAKLLGLPAVTAYLVAGVLIGPYVLGELADVHAFRFLDHLYFTDADRVASLDIITEVALGFIAFSIGNEFRLSALRTVGKQATVVGIVQAVGTTLVVDVALIAIHLLFPEILSLTSAVVLGAIASATAPAATMMVVRQYKAKGKLTAMLLPIVALDDAVGLVLFAVSFGIGKALLSGAVDVISIVVNPLLEIVGSLLLGALAGWLFSFSERFFHSRTKRLSISVAFVLLTVGLSILEIPIGPMTLSFSSLLSCMMLGTVFCNICDFSEELMDRIERWTAPMYVLFFVCSGAALDLRVFSDWHTVFIGVAYVVFRTVGKYFCNYGGCQMMSCDSAVTKNLGIAMLPQGGVALGMATLAAAGLGEDGEFIRLITLFGVLLFELFSPVLCKRALIRAGDVTPEGRSSHRGRREISVPHDYTEKGA